MNFHLLMDLLSLPTAPYREALVFNFVKGVLSKFGVEYFEDPWGNLVVGASSRAEYHKLIGKSSKQPLCVFLAHMDHPGFHGVKWISDNVLKVKWFGGSPKVHLESAPVWVADAEGWKGVGRLSEVKLLKNGKAIESAVVHVSDFGKKDFPVPKKLFGAFKFSAPVWQKDDLLYTKAADDLIGVYVILSLAVKLGKNKNGKKGGDKPTFMGVLTRAEEVGFMGAIKHFELGWLSKTRKPVMCVSLETSRTLLGAEFGKGPVVRLGDKMNTFDPLGLHVLTKLAEKMLKGKYQRRIMDGGTCEGSVALAFGFPAVGLAVPLGNYHNESFEGGPDSLGPLGPGPEFVHLDDVKGMLTLCEGMVQVDAKWKNPWEDQLRVLKDRSRKSSELLREGFAAQKRIGKCLS